MTKPGPSVTSGADTQPGSDSLFPSGFGGGSLIRAGGVGTSEIADSSVAAADLNLPSVAAALAARGEFTGTYATKAELATAGGSLTNTYPMRYLSKKAAAIKSGTAGRVKWLYFGDSYGNKIAAQISGVLDNAFGGRAGAGLNGSPGGTTTNSTSGTITANTTDFGLWPSGLTWTLGSAGASITYGVGGVAFTCDTIKVIYANAGGGFKVQVDGVDNTTPTVTSDNSIGITTISVTKATHTVSVVQTSGSPKVIGAILEDSTSSGTMYLPVYQGGIGLDSPTARAWTNWTAFLANVQPDVITFEMKETAATLTASLTAFLTATQAGTTTCDVVLVQSPPQALSQSDLIAQNATIKTLAGTFGVLTWDSYTPFKDYATLTALGYNGDGTHVSTDCDRTRGLWMLRDLGVLELALYEPTDAVTANTYVSNQLGIGTPASLNGAIKVINTDIAVDLARSVQFRTAAGSPFAFLDSRNAAANPSALPRYSQFGDTFAGIQGTSATLLGVRQGGTSFSSGQADMQARSFIWQTKSSSVSGSVTADLSLAGEHQLTLTGNVTSFAFSNAQTGGQLVRVHFIQDATGSRTLAGANAAIKWAGGSAPTLSTTANARDIFTFEVVGASYFEVSRSMNLL